MTREEYRLLSCVIRDFPPGYGGQWAKPPYHQHGIGHLLPHLTDLKARACLGPEFCLALSRGIEADAFTQLLAIAEEVSKAFGKLLRRLPEWDRATATDINVYCTTPQFTQVLNERPDLAAAVFYLGWKHG